MKMLKLAFWMACVFAAQTSAQEGINLSWDDCGSYGVSNKQFACDTNVGADVLVVSFRVNTPLPDFIGAQAILSVRGSSALPDWWKHYAGFAVMPCRDTLGLESDLAPEQARFHTIV